MAILMADIPHFDMPFRYHGVQPVVVEQDSLEDVTNCVEAIVRTPVGERVELPEFGSDDWTFTVQPIPVAAMLSSIASYEPRAVAVIEQEPDLLDNMIAKVTVKVAQLEEG